MSLGKNDVMNTLYNAGLITLRAVATSMVSRKLMKDDLGVTSLSQRILKLVDARWIGTREIFTEDKLRPRPTNGRCRDGRTVQRDSLCRSRLCVPQAGQERLRKSDGTTQQSNGDPQRREGEVVPEDRGEEEQNSTSETEGSGCEQGRG